MEPVSSAISQCSCAVGSFPENGVPTRLQPASARRACSRFRHVPRSHSISSNCATFVFPSVGFESQLVGAHAGSDVLVTVTFPKDYRATELAGKPAEFRCHIVEVREKSAYELDDVFAKEVGGCQTLEEMKQKLRQSLQDYYDERAEMEVQDTLMRQAAATLDYTPSAQELKEGIDAQVELLKAQLGRKGLTLEAYLQFTGKTEQQIRDDAKPEAENSLRIQKSAERIALLEGLTATDEDYANELAAICRQNGLTMEQLKPHMNAQFEASVRDNIRMKKAIAFVRANADVTVVDVPASKD